MGPWGSRPLLNWKDLVQYRVTNGGEMTERMGDGVLRICVSEYVMFHIVYYSPYHNYLSRYLSDPVSNKRKTTTGRDTRRIC